MNTIINRRNRNIVIALGIQQVLSCSKTVEMIFMKHNTLLVGSLLKINTKASGISNIMTGKINRCPLAGKHIPCRILHVRSSFRYRFNKNVNQFVPCTFF